VDEKKEYGLLINYEYCTGCFACVVACSQEYGWPAGMAGMKVMEVVENLPKDKNYLCFIPFPTELCVLCAGRRKIGLEPACVKHCMARVITCGPLDELTREMGNKKRMVLWKPR
jgi:Fe-S-cluster-containing dehydrogenase component